MHMQESETSDPKYTWRLYKIGQNDGLRQIAKLVQAHMRHSSDRWALTDSSSSDPADVD
jgi:hypothetical protein